MVGLPLVLGLRLVREEGSQLEPRVMVWWEAGPAHRTKGRQQLAGALVAHDGVHCSPHGQFSKKLKTLTQEMQRCWSTVSEETGRDEDRMRVCGFEQTEHLLRAGPWEKSQI